MQMHNLFNFEFNIQNISDGMRIPYRSHKEGYL
jgi:hypothetical protein